MTRGIERRVSSLPYRKKLRCFSGPTGMKALVDLSERSESGSKTLLTGLQDQPVAVFATVYRNVLFSKAKQHQRSIWLLKLFIAYSSFH